MKNNIITGIIGGIGGAIATFGVCFFIWLDYIWEAMGIAAILCLIVAIIVGVYFGKKDIPTSDVLKKSFYFTILYAAIICISAIAINGYIQNTADDYSYLEQNGIRTYEKDYYFN